MWSDIPRIRIWNRIEKSSQNRIRMHPHDIHIKIEYKYKYLYLYFKRIRIWIIRMFNPGSILTWASPVQTQNCPCSNLTTCAAGLLGMQTAKREEGGKECEKSQQLFWSHAWPMAPADRLHASVLFGHACSPHPTPCFLVPHRLSLSNAIQIS